jgi:hypothetical protein
MPPPLISDLESTWAAIGNIELKDEYRANSAGVDKVTKEGSRRDHLNPIRIMNGSDASHLEDIDEIDLYRFTAMVQHLAGSRTKGKWCNS